MPKFRTGKILYWVFCAFNYNWKIAAEYEYHYSVPNIQILFAHPRYKHILTIWWWWRWWWFEEVISWPWASDTFPNGSHLLPGRCVLLWHGFLDKRRSPSSSSSSASSCESHIRKWSHKLYFPSQWHWLFWRSAPFQEVQLEAVAFLDLVAVGGSWWHGNRGGCFPPNTTSQPPPAIVWVRGQNKLQRYRTSGTRRQKKTWFISIEQSALINIKQHQAAPNSIN